jgi:hypothetical protein
LRIFTGIGPDIIFGSGLTVLLLFGILTPKDALAGFANKGTLSVAVVFVVAAGTAGTQVSSISWSGAYSRGRATPSPRSCVS